MRPTIYLGADHAGFDKKTIIKEHLLVKDFIVEDLGAHSLNPHDDYTEFAKAVAGAVREHEGSLGILVCGSAEGVCITANKFDGIRAGIGFSAESAGLLREHDHGNILCLPGRVKIEDDLLLIVDTFIKATPSTEARHVRRVGEIRDLEQTN